MIPPRECERAGFAAKLSRFLSRLKLSSWPRWSFGL
jgi:hypothetical protein